eukprot:6250203-Lingulodinium_polyedra.AAC.1
MRRTGTAASTTVAPARETPPGSVREARAEGGSPGDRSNPLPRSVPRSNRGSHGEVEVVDLRPASANAPK